MLHKTMIAGLLAALSTITFASQRNDVPSCYDAYNITAEKSVERELFVVIDGTFDPDINLKRTVHAKVHDFLRPGDRFNILSFSAYLEDNYTNLKSAGQIEALISEDIRNSISKSSLKKFDICMKKQTIHIRKSIDQAIVSSFKPKNVEISNSEIIGNFSHTVRNAIAGSRATKKIVLVVSDMLENSDITSFYRSNTLRDIDPNHEFSTISNSEMLGNFNGASIFVIGGGWVPQKYRNSLRGSKRMKGLKDFWQLYFENSNASLVEFGMPVLIGNLK